MNLIKLKHTLSVLLTVLLITMSGFLYGAEETKSDPRTGSSIDGSNLTVIASAYSTLTPFASATTELVNSKLYAKLWMEDNNGIYYGNNWRVEVEYTITAETQLQSILGITKTLNIDYKQTGNYIDIDYDQLTPPSGEHFIKGSISNVKVTYEKQIGGVWTPQSASSLPSEVHFELSLKSEFYYDFFGSVAIPSIHTPFAAYDPVKNEQLITWDYVKGAESYELEILTIDLGRKASTSLQPSYDYDFKDAIRISTNKQHYYLPMVFTESFLLFRVRAVQERKGVNEDYKRLEGHFSSAGSGSITNSGWTYSQDAGSISAYHWIDPNNLFKDKSWQYSVSYAEEGKNAQAIVFYDKIMSPEQSVSVSNTNNTAIVGESVKDFVGRAAVNIMPAPIPSEGMRYYDNINLNGASSAYDYTNFDIKTSLLNTYITPDPLNATASKGSANYYSGNRTLQGVNSDYIPDADGYTYTRTKFTRDGTNRVVSQSGVGSSHKVGSGKETKYFYGTTNRKELDRLFGNNVGNSSNYKKNMVQDPNGQVSVSYIDGSGRTIATGLSIASPTEGTSGQSNMAIDSKPDETEFPNITENFSENNKVDGNVIASTKTILCQSPDNYQYTYTLDPKDYGDLCLTGDCEYDLTIFIIDESTGQKITLTNISKDGVSSPDSDQISEQLVNGSTSTTIAFKANLNLGSYQVTKEVVLSQDKIDEYYRDFIAKNNPDKETQDCYNYCLPDLLTNCDDCPTNCEASYVDIVYGLNSLGVREWRKTYYNELDEPVAYILYDVENCVFETTVQTIGLFTTTDYTDILAKISACITQCDVPDSKSPCDAKYQALLYDMSPSGQYFNNTPEIGQIGYNENDWLTANISSSEFNTFISSIHTGDLPSGVTITWDTLRKYWKPYMAEGLVEYHPEWCAFNEYCCVDESTTPRTINDYSMNPVEGCDIPQAWLADSMAKGLTEFLAKPSPATGYFTLENVANQTGGFTSTSAHPDYNDYHGATGMINSSSTSDPTKYTPSEFITLFSTTFLQKAKYAAATAAICNTTSKPFPLPPTPADPTTTPPTPENPNVSTDGFAVHFPKIDWSITPATTSSKASTAYKSACEGSADRWMNEFKCGAGIIVGTDLTNIKATLALLCENSYGATHTVTLTLTHGAGYSATVTTFQDVFTAVRAIYNMPYGPCPTPSIKPSATTEEEHCGCDQVFSFATSETGIALFNLDHSYSAISTTSGLNLEAILLSITSSADSYNYDLAYDGCMANPKFMHNNTSVVLPDYFDCTELDDIEGPNRCEDNMKLKNAAVVYESKRAYRDFIKGKADEWILAYKKACIDNVLNTETFTYSYKLREYHYTLYYYDQAGNLVQTVAPEGVYQRDASGMLFDETDDLAGQYTQSDDHRKGGASTFVDPDYAMHTNYKYNSLNQLTEQTTPDGGTSYFFYDKLGRLQASQNLEQANNNLYSYTRYDGLGRIKEVGELTSSTPLTDDISRDKPAGSWNSWLNSALPTRTQIVTTYYDAAPSSYTNTYNLENLRNRIAAVAYWDDVAQLGTAQPASASYYSYDINGNVHKLIQEDAARAAVDNNQKYKVIDYCYDLISGNVTQVDYQKNNPQEQFSHKYNYDADNRLTESFTSRNGVIWEKESKNLYYLHGPLARTELGDKQVQAQDYAYTLQGWLKAVNSSTGHKERDMGMDGVGGANQLFGIDAYGYSLHYFNGDYTATGAGALPSMIASYGGTDFDNESPDLFNGNISKMIVGLIDQLEKRKQIVGNTYKYDQLNRIKDYVPFTVEDENNKTIYANNTFVTISNPIIKNRFASNYSYDGNGNISFLNRNGSDILPNKLKMDNFKYFYNTSNLTTGHIKTDNKLYKVTDKVSLAGNYSNDLDGHNTTNVNYKYDDIGRLTSDDEEGIADIKWNVANKITEITKNTGQVISFTYDPMGNRITKKDANSAGTTTTFYVRDAQGNVMATYQESDITGDNIYALNDFHIYGSSRLGTKQEGLDIYHNSSPTGLGLENSFRELGDKRYELANHLGNVLEVISDRKLAIQAGTTSSVEHYTPDVISYSDYYPFGMLMPNRHGQDDDYRYGWNGAEKDDEVFGTQGTNYDLGARTYDARIGRMRSTDPLQAMYPWQSPFVYHRNSPISSIDYLGMGDPPVKKKDNEKGVYAYGQIEGADNADRSSKTWKVGDFMLQTLTFEDGSKGYLASRVDYYSKGENKDKYSSYTGSSHAEAAKRDMKQEQFIISAEGYSHFVKNNSSYYKMSKDQYNYDWTWGRMENGSTLAQVGMGYMWGEATGRTFSFGLRVTGATFRFTKGMISSFTKQSIKVTESTITEALKKSQYKTTQGAVSLPMVKRYVKMIENGQTAPAITVANGVIVEGNHRYVAGLITGKLPKVKPGTMASSQKPLIKTMKSMKVDPIDWDPPATTGN